MKLDVSREISFRTARSGGKGGQNVNKVETMVIGYFHIRNSTLFSDAQKEQLEQKLSNKINSEGFLQVKSQTHRSQLDNKQEVVEKIEALLNAHSSDQNPEKQPNPVLHRKRRRKSPNKKGPRLKILEKK